MTMAPPKSSMSISSLQEASLLPPGWAGFRPELLLHQVDSGQYLLEDPQSGDLFELSRSEAEVARRLVQSASATGACQQLVREQVISASALGRFLMDCQQQGLCRQTPAPDQSVSWSLMWRVPLWRPQQFLQRWLPALNPLFSRHFAWLLVLLGGVGFAGIAPQLELYASTANYLATPAGMLLFVCCIVVLKLGHELAHAFTAARLGVEVRQIGIIFMLLWPLLYTDVTDAWKVADRRKRASIALAGIVFELAVAAIAACLWLLLPDGIARTLAFIFSSVALVSSLLINLNPLMRFDGYYALMDYWNLPNLQQQAQAHCQQWRRHKMWGAAAVNWRPRLWVYGWTAWVWRWLISTLIIGLVWTSLGAPIAIIVGVFFMRNLLWTPLQQEWRFLRDGGFWRSAHSRRTAIGLIMLLALLLVPLPRSLDIAATVSAADQQHHSFPLAAELLDDLPALGQVAEKGGLLLSAQQPALTRDLALAEQELELRQRRHDALLLTGEQGGLRKTALAELARAKQDLERLQKQQQDLLIKAKPAAVVMARDEQLRAGDTVRAGATLLVTANPQMAQLDLYLSQRQLAEWLEQTAAGVTITLANGQQLFQVLADNLPEPQLQLSPPAVLMDHAGGPIATQISVTGKPQALGSWYQLQLPLAAPAPYLNMPAIVNVELGYRNLAARLFDAFS